MLSESGSFITTTKKGQHSDYVVGHSALVHHASLCGTTIIPNLHELSWLQFSHVAQCLPFLSLTLRRVTLYVQAASPSPWTGTLTQGRHDVLGEYTGLFGILDVCSHCVEEPVLKGVDFQTSAYLVARRTIAARRPVFTGSPPRGRDILHAVDSPMLHTASLSVIVPDYDTDGWTRCASVLSARFSTSFRTLHAECVRSGIVVPDRARPFTLYIKPRLAIRQLRECAITIEDPAGVALTNEDLDTTTCSWSSLPTLEMNAQRFDFRSA
ncbi:hypothetical protein BD311DRAFT_805446 [Dichomitus squalens]|uniref:Uncharacterized protein n=1 Tax=Dichomitus squalens TaxID=114155 RepID=A0A4Q9MR55_9APHY|nr:hypothetical protein BD311DRAFT_805446 [Dichomitus squalens]